MKEKEFLVGVLGEKFWKHSELLPDKRTYSQWYFDEYERGVWNIYNAYNLGNIRPFFLTQHDSYEIYRTEDPLLMDCWDKYIKPGWNIERIARVDGNAIIGNDVAIKLPAAGFVHDIGHSDYFYKFPKTKTNEVFDRIRSLEKGPTVVISDEYQPLPKIDTGFYNGTRIDGDYTAWMGVSVGNLKMLYFGGEPSIYSLCPDYKCEPLLGEEVITHYLGGASLDFTKPIHCLSRGVVPGNFVETYLNDEGKVYKMQSFTNLSYGGDLTSEHRKIINEENLKYVIGGEVVDPRKHSFRAVGHDVVIGLPEDDRVGVFEIDEWLRILQPLVMLHWAGEFAMAVSCGFVVFSVVNGYYFILYRFLDYLNEDCHWNPEIRYSCYWDHRHIDVKELEWAFANNMREAMILELTYYMDKYQWAMEHSLSVGYSLWGIRLRLYEWLDVFSSGIIW